VLHVDGVLVDSAKSEIEIQHLDACGLPRE
jgi:hypothetical protein